MNRSAISRLYAEAEYMRDLTITKPEFRILLGRRMKNFMAVSAPARLTHVAGMSLLPSARDCNKVPPELMTGMDLEKRPIYESERSILKYDVGSNTVNRRFCQGFSMVDPTPR